MVLHFINNAINLLRWDEQASAIRSDYISRKDFANALKLINPSAGFTRQRGARATFSIGHLITILNRLNYL